MLRSLINKELRDRRWSLAAYSAISILFMLMYIALFPSIKNEAANYNQLLASMPKALTEAFNLQAASFTELENFLAIELFSITWPLLMALLALSRAGSSITGEIEKGSMGMLLSLPMSRSKLLSAKLIAGVMAILIFTSITVMTVVPLSVLFSVNIHIGRFIVLTILGSLYGVTIFALTCLLASVASERSKVYFIIGGTLTLMYTCNIISNLKESLAWLRFGSVFYYFNASDVLARGSLNAQSVLVYAGASILCFAGTYAYFNKRDIVV